MIKINYPNTVMPNKETSYPFYIIYTQINIKHTKHW